MSQNANPSPRATPRRLPLAVAAALALSGVPAQALEELPNRVAAGDVTQTSAVLWARPSLPGRVWFTYATDEALSQNPIRIALDSTDLDRPAKASIKGLQPNTPYYYCAEDLLFNKSCGRFRTLPEPTSTQGVTFGAAGRVEWQYDLYPGINNLPKADLDLLVDLTAATDTLWGYSFTTYGEHAGTYRKSLMPFVGQPNAWAQARASAALVAVPKITAVRDGYAGGALPSSDPRFENSGSFINETPLYRTAIRALREQLPLRSTEFGSTGDPRTSGKPKFERVVRIGKDAVIITLDIAAFRDTPIVGPTNPLDPTQAGQYLMQTYTPGRTALGSTQLADLKVALLEAKAKGVRWKFIAMDGIMQNFGAFGGVTRHFANYALERNEILRFIADNDIRNVVFIGTSDELMVNNLAYQGGLGQPWTSVDAWEISLPPVADFSVHKATLTVDEAAYTGMISSAEAQYYRTLPIAADTDDAANDRDDFIKGLYNNVLQMQGLDTLGLAGSGIPATLIEGDYFSKNANGWAKFHVEAGTQRLTVTVYGLEDPNRDIPESEAAVEAARQPRVFSRFKVLPR